MVRISIGRFLPLILLPVAAIISCTPEQTEPSDEFMRVELLSPSLTVPMGSSLQMAARVKDASGTPQLDQTIEWHSSDEAMALVSSNGLVTAISQGSVTITANGAGQSAAKTLQIVPPADNPAADIELDIESRMLRPGENLQLTARAYDDGGQEVSSDSLAWTSDDTDVATVSDEGLVTAVNTGTASITANIGDVQSIASIRVVGAPQIEQQ